MKYIFFFLFLFSSVVTPILVAAQTPEATPSTALPETFEGAQQFGEQIIQQLPKETEKVFQEEALPILQAVLSWGKNIWNGWILPWLQEVWDRVLGFLGQEVEKRKPIIKDAIEQEKEEIIKEIETGTIKAGKSLWERIKGFFKENDTEN